MRSESREAQRGRGCPLTATDSVLVRLESMSAVWPSATVTSEANWRLAMMGMLFNADPVRASILISRCMVTFPEDWTLGVALRVRPRSSYWICGMVVPVLEPRYWLRRLETLTPLMVAPARAAELVPERPGGVG